MISYILPQLSKLSNNSKQFPLLTNEKGAQYLKQQDSIYPQTITTPEGQNQPLFSGGIISEADIDHVAYKTALSLVERYHGKSLLIVTILEGARTFAKFVHHHLILKQQGSGIKISQATIKIKSYESCKQATTRQVVQPLTHEDGGVITNFPPYDAVILIDDLIDSGDTIAWLVNSYFKSFGETNIESYFMLEKATERQKEIERIIQQTTKIIGQKVPDEWVVGFGLDISLPDGEGDAARHLFRGRLPGGIYTFNSTLEPYLLEAFGKNNQTVMKYLKVYLSKL